jgi:hypothetical protein
MKTMWTVLALVATLAWTTMAPAGEGCAQAEAGTCAQAKAGGCGGDQGGCIWGDAKAEFALAEQGDALTLAVVVNGCGGKRAAFQKKLADELARDAAGGGCSQCPFSVPGLSFKAENTDLGATVKVTGPADKRAEFKARYEKKIAARKDAPTPGGCGCGHEPAAFGE